jgi:biotin carboxyl carrier protein
MARIGDGAPGRAPERAAARLSFPGIVEADSAVVEVGEGGQITLDGEALDGWAFVEDATGEGATGAPIDAGHADRGGAGSPGGNGAARVSRVRVTNPEGTHVALVSPMPDRHRATIGTDRVEVVVDGWRFEVDVEPEARARLRERATSARGAAAGAGPLELRAIIPGRIVSVDVAAGDSVETGGRLLVLEAMKMQNELRSPRSGTVARVAVGAGQTVERGDVLLVLE